MEQLTYALVGLVILILIFFLLREVMCWYYKINARLGAQQETNVLLNQILEELRKQSNTKTDQV